MRILLGGILFSSFCLTFAHADVKDTVYDGKEIYLHVKKDHVTTVLFPEPITSLIRGFGADTFVIERPDKEPETLELMPTTTEVAEMTVTGLSGEDYIVRTIASEKYYTKCIIHKMETAEKNGTKTIAAKMDNAADAVLETSKQLPAGLDLRITLKGNDLPLRIYLSTISEVTGFNIITTPVIESQKASINLENIEIWRALKSLLYGFGYGFKVSQNDLIITEKESRIFNITIPAVDQSFKDETSNESFANNTNSGTNTASINQQNQQVNVGTKIYYENSSPKLSLWTDLENNIKSMITPKGTYSVNRSSGSIVVTDKPQVLDQIGELVATINDNLSRQQSFEIQILEVSLSSDHEAGIDWNAIAKKFMGFNSITASTNFTSSGFLSGQLFSLSAAGPDAGSGTSKGGVSLMIKALDAMGDVNVVSRPSITVSNLFPCVIQEVTSIPFISGTGQTIGDNVTQSNVTTSQVSDGLTMRLEGKIEDHKTVLNISVAVNTLDSMTNIPVSGGLTIQEPQVSTKSITTNVGVEPGKTLILGGLISSTKNNSTQGIPYLNRIPVLGNAFSYKAKSNKKTELVIIITPKSVIKNS